MKNDSRIFQNCSTKNLLTLLEVNNKNETYIHRDDFLYFVLLSFLRSVRRCPWRKEGSRWMMNDDDDVGYTTRATTMNRRRQTIATPTDPTTTDGRTDDNGLIYLFKGPRSHSRVLQKLWELARTSQHQQFKLPSPAGVAEQALGGASDD